MFRRSKKHRGVYQRCTGDCPADRCARHSWSYSVELPARGGKRQQITKAGFPSAKAAARARAELIQQHRDGKTADDKRMTLGLWLEQWLTARERGTDDPLRATTLHAYRHHVRDYWHPKLAHMRLRDLRREDVSRALAEIVAERDAEVALYATDHAVWLQSQPATSRRRKPKAFTRTTLTRVRATLSSALGDAVDAGLIASNPAQNVKLRKGKRRPAADTPPPKAWSAEDVARFLDATAAEGDPLAPAWHLAALHGLRRGELCGLEWSAVDLDASVVHVERTRTTAGYEVVEDDPKSEHSRADVALDAATVELLRGHRARQAEQRLILGDAWEAGDLLFAREDGQPWHPDRVSKLFGQAVDRHGLPRITLRGLRHTSASVQIAAGVAIEIVSKRLRHANVTITSGVYSHLVGDAGRNAASAAADAVAKHRKAAQDHDP